MATYKIIRHFFEGRKRIVKRGLTLEEAQKHCKNPETSSWSCKLPENVKRTKKFGNWFDGYAAEEK
jgi:hypothetical protein